MIDASSSNFIVRDCLDLGILILNSAWPRLGVFASHHVGALPIRDLAGGRRIDARHRPQAGHTLGTRRSRRLLPCGPTSRPPKRRLPPHAHRRAEQPEHRRLPARPCDAGLQREPRQSHTHPLVQPRLLHPGAVHFRQRRPRRLPLRGEMFNLTTTPRFHNQNTTIGAANPGIITTAGSPSSHQCIQRQIQVAAKFTF